MAIAVSAVAMLASPAALAQDSLADEVITRIRQANPQLQVRKEADRLVIRGPDEAGAEILELSNLREICVSTPRNCERAMQVRVDSVASRQLRNLEGFDVARVRAVLRPLGYVEAMRKQAGSEADLPILFRPFSKDLVRMWVVDSGQAMSVVLRRQADERNLTTDDLDKASAANMSAERVPPLRQHPEHPAVWVSFGNDYVSSVLLDDALWARVAGPQARKNVTVCVPERHMLIAYFPDLDPRGEVDPDRMCQLQFSRGSARFSAQPIRRINDNWDIR